jgi:hypothetical protein
MRFSQLPSIGPSYLETYCSTESSYQKNNPLPNRELATITFRNCYLCNLGEEKARPLVFAAALAAVGAVPAYSKACRTSTDAIEWRE